MVLDNQNDHLSDISKLESDNSSFEKHFVEKFNKLIVQINMSITDDLKQIYMPLINNKNVTYLNLHIKIILLTYYV